MVDRHVFLDMSYVFTPFFTLLTISSLAFLRYSYSVGVHAQVFTVGFTKSQKFVIVSPMEYDQHTCSMRPNHHLAVSRVFGNVSFV